jgi:hypothetical protein
MEKCEFKEEGPMSIILRTDDPRYQVAEIDPESGLSYKADSVDKLLRWAFAVREQSLSGSCSLSTNPDEANVHRLRIPEKLTEAGWVIGCAVRTVRMKLRHFIFGYYSHRDIEREMLVDILCVKILGERLSPDHRAWRVIRDVVQEHAHPNRISSISERQISRETGWSGRQCIRSSTSIRAYLDSWRDELEEVLMPVFKGKGWIS